MEEDLPTSANVVVIGGGIVGCSVAYHLVERGVRDVLLLERRRLTCGTTWHAAGLVGQLRATRNLTRLAQYSCDLYRELEERTGQATGYLKTGSISIATDPQRLEELERGASMAQAFDLEVHRMEPSAVAERWPEARTDDILGAVYLPGDASTSPVDTTRALAAGARAGGARILEGVEVTEVRVESGTVRGVVTDRGFVKADAVVNCAGMWARELGRGSGVDIALHAAEHFYIITEPVAGVRAPLPTLREPGACSYFKTEAGGALLIGFFEPRAKPWGMNGIPPDFEFDSLADDPEHLAPQLEAALHRIPGLEEAGIRTFFNGPESFTPDNRYLLGEAPAVSGYFVAAGFNSIGIQSAGGAGKVLADWIVDGAAPMDLWDVDVRRMMPFQADPDYLQRRTVETPGLLYAMHWPFRQYETARGILRSPFHERLEQRRACFGELGGWERPTWFAPKGVEPRTEYSWGRQNWFAHVEEEHLAVREAVGLFDQTSFSKFCVEGAEACAWLNRLCANDIDVAPGRIVYTSWLNERGGIEADLTVTRLASDSFWIVSGAATRRRDRDWLERHRDPRAEVAVRDITENWAVLGVMGPGTRGLMGALTSADCSNAAFPFGTSRVLDLAGVRARASRITYVGELGWELYVECDRAGPVYEALADEGRAYGLRHAGFLALDSLRLEKGYRHWSHDVTPDDTPLEAGLGFAVKFEKAGGFIGREALEAQRERGLTRRLMQFALEDAEPLLYHDEPIWRDGVRVGSITSGRFGHTLGRSLGMGYVSDPGGVDRDFLRSGRYEIENAGQRFPAGASIQPFYAPRRERPRS
ncbi:MAG: FAD-dependent oxidoreductase [Myxococcota bacterium]|nr:FAD-dependent oxidoreductase [Myxococcota bacterium]